MLNRQKHKGIPSVNSSFNENFTWSKDPLTGATTLTGASGSNFSVNSGVTLYNASRINNQIKQADLEIEGGKYSLETTKESISLSILNAYLQVLYAEEQVKNSQKQIESTTGQLNLAGRTTGSSEHIGLRLCTGKITACE